jgi:hypothetical protein
MKYIKNYITIAFLALGCILFSSCENNSNKNNSSNSGNSGLNPSLQQEQPKEELSFDGIYTGSQNISGLELVAKLTINGNRWSAISQLGYDNQEYQNGVVKGKDLYDDSGMIKIGYVSGNSANINGYPSMSK